MQTTLELVRRSEEGLTLLCAPDVGLFTRAVPRGQALVAGQTAGVLVRLATRSALVVPAGVAGLVVSDVPDAVQAPVGAGDVLYRLEPLDAEGLATTGEEAADGPLGLVLPSPQSGRFYHRPSPGDPAFAEPGSVVEDGQPVGLIEVMKTFTHVAYRASGGLPARARIVAYHTGDGEDVLEGDALLEVEQA